MPPSPSTSGPAAAAGSPAASAPGSSSSSGGMASAAAASASAGTSSSSAAWRASLRDRLVADGGRPHGRPELERRRRLLRPGALFLAFGFLLPPVIEHGRTVPDERPRFSGILQGNSISDLAHRAALHGVMRGRHVGEREAVHRQRGQRADRRSPGTRRRPRRAAPGAGSCRPARSAARGSAPSARAPAPRPSPGRRRRSTITACGAATARSSARFGPSASSTIRSTPVRRDGADLLRGVLVAIVDDRVGAGRARQLRLLLARDGRGHARARPLRELDRRVPDRARAAGDEHVGGRRSGRRRAGSGTRSAPGCPSDAPSSNDAPRGSGTACSAGTTEYCAAVPHWRCQAAK